MVNKIPPPLFIYSLQSPFAEVSIVWGNANPVVRRIFLSNGNASASTHASVTFPGISPGLNHHITQLGAEIKIMLSGGVPEFDIGILDFSVCSAFQRKVIMEERTISRGEVSSYGLIARRIGVPGAARAVGNALSANPFPLVIPCHRAVRSDGRIGGFQGGSVMKHALLEMEGIIFDPSGRISKVSSILH